MESGNKRRSLELPWWIGRSEGGVSMSKMIEGCT